MWFKRQSKNRRSARSHDVLDVRLRSSQVRTARVRLASVGFGVLFGTVFGLYVLWRAGEWALDRMVYENKAFSIQQVDVQTDGVISREQLRRWSGVRPGENLLALDLARVKRDLEMVPMIQSASIERILPGSISIRVAERVPVAQVNVPRPREGGGIELVVFQISADGWVMLPLDPRQRAVPLSQADDQLPVISGSNVTEMQPGRRVESAQALAALRLIGAFQSSPMANQVDLKQVNVASAQVLVAKTGQGSEITFGLDDFDGQMLRWWKVQLACARLNRTIGTLDLAVLDYTPLRLLDSGSVPPQPPKAAKPQRTRKRNV